MSNVNPTSPPPHVFILILCNYVSQQLVFIFQIFEILIFLTHVGGVTWTLKEGHNNFFRHSKPPISSLDMNICNKS